MTSKVFYLHCSGKEYTYHTYQLRKCTTMKEAERMVKKFLGKAVIPENCTIWYNEK